MARGAPSASLGTVCRFAGDAFWREVAPSAAEVTEYVTRSMRLVGNARGAAPAPFASLAGTAVDSFVGLQRVGVLSKRAWREAPYAGQWRLDAPAIVKKAGLIWSERDPHGPRGIDKVFLRIRVPSEFEELAEVLRQILWNLPPGQEPGHLEIAALLAVARFDAFFRAGDAARGGLKVLESLLPVGRGLKRQLLELHPRQALEGIRETCRSMMMLLPQEQPFVFNPRWSRMGRLRESDGDFISGATLYDLKCIDPRKESISREHLFQLLGYACMNACTPKAHRILAVGIINPRAGFVWSMSLAALCRAIGATSFETLVGRFREKVGVETR